jgi:hypothetical protein
MGWTQFTIFIFANMVFMLTLCLWNRTESRADNRSIISLITSIQEEMKDFHGRLERQDAEFRTRFLAIEMERK